ncbi:MAG: ACT domain-containing protein [bacterium]
MNDQLKKIIRESSFKIEDGRYVYAKVSEFPEAGKHFMVTKDDEEITVVTREENLGGLMLIETNKEFYRLISLDVSVPFYAVGFLAAVSNEIAKEGINILIVSTYSKDYFLIRDDKIEEVELILKKLGFKSK